MIPVYVHSFFVFLYSKCAYILLIYVCHSGITIHSFSGLSPVGLMSYSASLQPCDNMFFLDYRSRGLVTTEQSQWAQF